MPGQGTASDLTVMHALFISGQTHTRLGYTVTSHSYACIYHFRLDARLGYSKRPHILASSVSFQVRHIYPAREHSDLSVMHALFISGQTHTRLGYTVTSHSYACIYHFRLDARVGAQQVSPDQVPLGTVHICK